jgi:hypothetical protein
MVKYFRISSYIRKPFLIHDFASDSSEFTNMRNISFSFLSVCNMCIHIHYTTVNIKCMNGTSCNGTRKKLEKCLEKIFLVKQYIDKIREDKIILFILDYDTGQEIKHRRYRG